MNQKEKIILTGMQPTGLLHLGHLLGVICNFTSLELKYKCYFMIADLHALTSFQNEYSKVNKYTLGIVSNWIASGINLEKSTIFLQSLVPEHAELYLILTNFTPISWLLRNPTFKEKQENLQSGIENVGFLSYPILQAADILLYKANYVPIGEDQLAHLEITREIARRLETAIKKNRNNPKDSPLLTLPQPLLSPSPKVIGTDGRKMSKSYNNTIKLLDSPQDISEKIKKMKTDTQRIKKTDRGNPLNCPVFTFYSFFAAEIEKEISSSCKTANIGCVDCKKIISKKIIENTEKFRNHYDTIQKKPKDVKELLFESSKKAQKQARENLDEIKDALAFFK